MLLAFDIGNTNTVIGCFRGEDLECVLRFKTDPERTVDEYEALLLPLLTRRLGADFSFGRSIISSVVPPVTPDVIRLCATALDVTPLVVGPGIKTGLAIRTEDPAAVGADRVVNAVAARELYGAPALVIDFGTATSFDFVSAEGAYEGGIIAPGIRISLDALVEHTAKLPRIQLTWPEHVIGKGTVSAMQSGAVLGYSCLVDGMIERIEAEVGAVKHILATGGVGKLFAERSEKIAAYQPDLTLHGLRIIADMNGG